MTDHTTHNEQNNNTKLTAKSSSKIAIIGGGLSGLFTATLLERKFAQHQHQHQHSNLQITLFEKSRGVGRLATRYRSDTTTGKNWQWSFGAQFFTAKTDSFQQFITPWLDSGLVQPWRAQVVNLSIANEEGQPPPIEQKEQWGTEQPRYVSTPKMTSWGRALADQLQQATIQFKTRVAPFAQYSNLQASEPTELFDDNGNSLGQFDWVICTAPNGQAAELMADSGFTNQAKIMQPKMLACYTLMLGWNDESKLPDSLKHSIDSQDIKPWDVAYLRDSILAKIFVEHHKPNHEGLLPSVTMHADNDWSEQQVDQDIDEITAQLLAAAKNALNWTEQTAPSQIDCHRWRYAATSMASNDEGDAQPLGVLVDKEQQWIVSGDWCGRGNIESCYQTAEEVVEVIAATLEV
ncbi:NAD(P)/FAD-dependent oxidoreductase [Psychrobacter sp. 1U2]|uniref:NAD(P)/FAD-dependent oxidoreductase n=1 Tax=Psychrobacter sp. 1U2 TaxID=3453577 RepID=UPI003F46E27D